MVPYWVEALVFLAGVVAGLVQAPGVGRIDALFDVVQGSEERQFNAGALHRVVQTCVSGQDAGGVESRLLENFFLQVATEKGALVARRVIDPMSLVKVASGLKFP